MESFSLDHLSQYSHIAGVDEVGRGPLAGPVVTAAVILDPTKPIAGLADSKKLTEKRRELLFDEMDVGKEILQDLKHRGIVREFGEL